MRQDLTKGTAGENEQSKSPAENEKLKNRKENRAAAKNTRNNRELSLQVKAVTLPAGFFHTFFNFIEGRGKSL